MHFFGDGQNFSDVLQSHDQKGLENFMSEPKHIILASASPRRRDLLSQASYECHVIPSKVNEVPQPGELPEAYCKRNAQEKAIDTYQNQKSFARGKLLLAADTIVVSTEGDILEKPSDAAHAKRMLETLSGGFHKVLTGYCLVDGNEGTVLVNDCITTQVEFRALSPDEISNYVASGEPFDKAGSYGIQGQAACFVKQVQGSYTNVIGLPLAEVVQHIREFLPNVRANRKEMPTNEQG